MKPDPHSLGLRAEDLDADTLAARAAWLAGDPEAARAHRDALTLGAHIAALPDAPAPTARAPRVRAPHALALALAAAAASLFVVLPEPAPLRARGSADATLPAPELRAVAEGPTGVRVLVDGDRVAADERVVFEVRTSVAGRAELTEEGPASLRVWPAAGAWDVSAGHHLVGGARAQAWRAEGQGPRTYVATLCVPDGACASSRLQLDWQAP